MECEATLHPAVPVTDGDYPVYPSRGHLRDIANLTGIVCLNDFGSARVASTFQEGWWMPDTYPAPEILMGVPWNCQVDKWSIGIRVTILATYRL